MASEWGRFLLLRLGRYIRFNLTMAGRSLSASKMLLILVRHFRRLPQSGTSTFSTHARGTAYHSSQSLALSTACTYTNSSPGMCQLEHQHRVLTPMSLQLRAGSAFGTCVDRLACRHDGGRC